MKCIYCNKKTHMLLNCKCQIECCVTCLDPMKHNCTRDFKQEQKEKLEKELVLVESCRLQKL